MGGFILLARNLSRPSSAHAQSLFAAYVHSHFPDNHTNTASRPLLPPNELLDIVPGNIFVYCFTFHPLRSKVTLFYECLNKGVIKLLPTPDIYIPGKFFDEAAIYYDIHRRNDIVVRRVNTAERRDLFEW